MSFVQTYERTAILDWWGRGHRTCPATNTSLSSFQLAPNYVLKRSDKLLYVVSWHDVPFAYSALAFFILTSTIFAL